MSDFNKIDSIVNLLLAERERKLSNDENQLLQNWLDKDKKNRALYDSLKDETNIPEKIEALSAYNSDKAYNEFVANTQQTKTRKLYREVLKYAAILVPFIFVAWFLFQRNNNAGQDVQLVKTEIQPGSSKAILKLDDGRVVNLEGENNLIADLNGTVVQSTSKEIKYNRTTGKIKERQIEYNEIEIPRGGEYQLILSDGTKVWLNSETSIRYPVGFASKKREVYLQNGEAFFEVTENKESPFIVHTTKMDVNVLGTSFNVRAYSDENKLTTTLVTGKVSINQTEQNEQFNLLPNQQASLSETGMDIKSVDVNKYIAWKNGRILFEENTLVEIFNDLSRWYNIDVDFENIETSKLRFSVDVERYDELSEILHILEMTKKVKFEIEENMVRIK